MVDKFQQTLFIIKWVRQIIQMMKKFHSVFIKTLKSREILSMLAIQVDLIGIILIENMVDSWMCSISGDVSNSSSSWLSGE